MLAILSGIIVSFVVIALVEALGTWMYPPPAGMTIADPASVRAAMEHLPVGALLMVLAAWLAGTSIGAFIAARVGARSWTMHGLIIGIVAMIAGLADLLMFPHPLWFWIAAMMIFIPSGMIAGRFAAPRS